MEAYRTEEEQIDAVKRWWKEKGLLVLVAIALVVVGYFSWQYYEHNNDQYVDNASVLYQELQDVNGQLAEKLDESTLLTAHRLADQLKADYSNSPYAQFAALINARLYVENHELVKAEKELRWVLDHAPDKEITGITELRLARVLTAEDKPDQAIKLINKKRSPIMQVGFDELHGDILRVKGEISAARQAYEKAQQAIVDNQLQSSPLLELKLDNLPVDKKAS